MQTDDYDLTVALCQGGTTEGGYPCTGHAHAHGKHLKCSDPVHNKSAEFVIEIPPEGLQLGPSVPAGAILTGQKWTCS